MDSLLLLCARRIVAQRPLPALPADFYPVLFQAAFLDGRALVLQDLVATWPFPVLNFQQLLGHLDCAGMIPTLTVSKPSCGRMQELVEPRHQSSGCWLHVLDMTAVMDDPEWRSEWTSTKALARACVEVSRHQQKFQRRGSKRHSGCSGATTGEATPRPPGMDVHADLVIDRIAYGFLCEALQPGAVGLLRLKCREFQAVNISALEIVTLLESLDPSCLRRVELPVYLGLADLLMILPHLSRFPELRSLKVRYSKLDLEHLTPESAIRLRCVARQLGMLSGLRELNLNSTRLSGNLHQILCDLQAPLESLDLGNCCLVPDDLTFLSQSIHAPALKRLDLWDFNISQDLLEPFRLLLEEASASLLHLDLTHGRMDDSHLAALLPTLLCCSRLRFLGLYGTSLSMAMIKNLLQKTLKLPDLHLVAYPIPEDCYKWDQTKFDRNIFFKFVDWELLSAAEEDISQLLANSGRTDLVWTFRTFDHGALDFFSL
ncbi:leucine-rich repeat-containing protein 14-like [Oenanthe melanoleuca]|uniref:leucine-rich repeat-containing protein 14-like n=1 Tax=Oenanthe melanoleuca TaxID=2939378 RepID=UPI0024C1590E|nr:leucine-rich repeat-containing protein 14-like [Oenanthe melanoleuca]XP_056371585.1 leucine-rich repeat-containing protein 14-like [Oenanthe melanoleuca]XP_056371586.1 leucine-rich repeat-containing protein 14-like [Oenanthe melanoleuca]XP_056371588.1 leucine-rich repeat-containing protein 14-like [Oenanthe melanoleuca]